MSKFVAAAVVACATFLPANAELRFTKAEKHFSATNGLGQPIYIYELAQDVDGETRHAMYARYNGLLDFAQRQKARAATPKQRHDHAEVFKLFPQKDCFICLSPKTIAEKRVRKLNIWLQSLLALEKSASRTVTFDDFKIVEVRNSGQKQRKSNEYQGHHDGALKARCETWLDDINSNEDTSSPSVSEQSSFDGAESLAHADLADVCSIFSCDDSVISSKTGSDVGSFYSATPPPSLEHDVKSRRHAASLTGLNSEYVKEEQYHWRIKRWASSLQHHVTRMGVLDKQHKIDKEKDSIAEILQNAAEYQRNELHDVEKKIRFVQDLATEISKTFRHSDYFHTLVSELECHAFNDSVITQTVIVDDACQPFIQEFGVEIILRMAEREPNQYKLKQYAHKFLPQTDDSIMLYRQRFDGYLFSNKHFTHFEKNNMLHQIFEADDQAKDFVTQPNGLRIAREEAKENKTLIKCPKTGTVSKVYRDLTFDENNPYATMWLHGEDLQAKWPAL